MNKEKPALGPVMNGEGQIIRPRRGDGAGIILGPSGGPALLDRIAELNRQNRRRLHAEIGPWQAVFKENDEVFLKSKRFEVREMKEDLLVLGYPDMIKDKDWFMRFKPYSQHREIFPLRGYEFHVMNIYSNCLQLVCKGKTGSNAKRGRKR